MDSAFTLKDKKILITGASSGIGNSIAIECSRAGAFLYLTGRNRIRLEGTIKSLEGVGHTVIVADLNRKEDIKFLTDTVPRLNGIVHCAGINNKALIKFLNPEGIEEVMKTNFLAPVMLFQSLIKNKKIENGASLVLISSIASTYATVSNAIYASSKGALNSFIRVMALELAPQKIRVNGIQPGMVETDILKAYDLQEELKESLRSYPLGRFGRPEDIAYSTIFLLSDVTGWITGTSLIVDGGVTLR